MDISPEHYQIYIPTTTVFDFKDPHKDPKFLSDTMKKFMSKKVLFGLSSSNIGGDYSIFVFGDPYTPDNIIECFNPKLLHVSKEMEKEIEMSLDYQGLEVKVKRPETIRVEFANSEGDINKYTYNGISARIWLHEYDNLCGISIKNRVSRLAWKRAIKKMRKKKKRNV